MSTDEVAIGLVSAPGSAPEIASILADDLHAELSLHLPAVQWRVGYPDTLLDAVPPDALAPFAGVGWFFDLADLRPGESVVDFGCGSGTDSFVAAQLVGPEGRVLGIDYTPEQFEKATRLAEGTELRDVVEFWRVGSRTFPSTTPAATASSPTG